jgi:hypothetical protein
MLQRMVTFIESALTVVAVVSAISLSPSPVEASQDPPAAVESADLDAIREAVVRYQVKHLADDISKDVLSKVSEFCLGLGRFGGTAPSVEFIDRFRDISPRLVAAPACGRNEGKGVRIPLWIISENLIRPGVVDVRGRAGTLAFKYIVELKANSWHVNSATQTGRGMTSPSVK